MRNRVLGGAALSRDLQLFSTLLAMKFKEHISLAPFSNYKIGGNARFFFEPKNETEVAWAIAEAQKKKLKVFILGGGTNLLLSDEGFDGLVIRPALTHLEVKGNLVTVESGVLVAQLLKALVAASLSGFEWAGGLPGTIGGAVRGNAGCFGGETKDSVVSVRSFNPKKMVVVERSSAACKFGYRDSIFKHTTQGEIILSVVLRLEHGKKTAILKTIKEHIAYRAANHPLEYPNIGSIFKNVPLAQCCKAGSKRYREAVANKSIDFRGSEFSVKTDPFPVISAAKLISEVGLRGMSFGGAMISPKHPNFIVNIARAHASDVKHLIALAKAKVKSKFGVQLEEEIQTI
jgi:UDP-N-acetylmuramate dehydrogenase